MEVIKNKTDDLYIHYDPHTKSYFVGKTLVGAVIFKENNASLFLKENGLEDEWLPQLINDNVKITRASRLKEKNIFDELNTKK